MNRSRTGRPVFAWRAAILTALVAGAAFAGLAAALVPWAWVPEGDLVPVEAGQLFTREQIARAEEYAGAGRHLGWASYGVSLTVTLVLGLTPLGARLVRKVSGRLPWWLTVVVGTAVLLLVGRAVTLPFAVAGRRLNLEYGLSTQSWAGWAADYAKSYAVGLVATSLLLLVIVGVARRSPRYWFAWAGGIAAVFVLAASFLYPVVVEPLFTNFRSMPAGPFRESVFALAEKEGVQIDDVLVSDASARTTTLNAYVSGFGGTRHVVVYDNLLNQLTPAQARVVIAHELAHAKNHDVLVGTVLGAVGSVGAVALLAMLMELRRTRRVADVRGPGDPAAIALVLALTAVGTSLASPLQNTISRAVETRADRVSLQATGNDAAFVAMQRQLALSSLSDPTPPFLSQFWFGSHPTVLQRAGLPSSLEGARSAAQPDAQPAARDGGR